MLPVLRHALTITFFVVVMMLFVEYVHVQTRGTWQEKLRKWPLGQVVLGAALGATPGCLGAFTVVSLYGHRSVGFGALVATMIATSGDEAFVLFSMVPGQAAALTGLLFMVALVSGLLVDRLYPGADRLLPADAHGLELHAAQTCRCLSWPDVGRQLARPSRLRISLLIGALVGLGLLVSGLLGPAAWGWKRATFAGGGAFALFVFATVPEHFLEAHLWKHVIEKHLLRIFLWTAGVLLLVHYAEAAFDVAGWIRDNPWTVLAVASGVGLVPESGPHLVFVTLFAQGTLPIGVLVANSIVQDGHGTLPLIAVSRRAFVALKVVNLVVGLAVGGLVLWLWA